MIGFYNYTVILTYVSLLISVFGSAVSLYLSIAELTLSIYFLLFFKLNSLLAVHIINLQRNFLRKYLPLYVVEALYFLL